MKQIIRSIAVETLSQRGNLGRKLSDLYPRQVFIQESLVLSPTVTLSVLPKSSDIVIKNKSNKSTSCENKALSALLYVVWENKLDFLPRVVIWVCTGKIVQVSYTPGKQITALMTRIMGKIKARAEQAALRALVLKVNLLKFLPNIRKTTQLAVKIAKTKTWLHNIWMQGTQQSSFRNKFFCSWLREPLRS
ncbi:hypothetical protein H6G06_03235 [Anabaena sphaerica FACHB-251]|uniref:Uncharacterized protein n=1 Tax=Anabaena sphaerica FACHB-251 TaxID=2692883 RepID=A0A926ZZG8_9NOST|nr:hypothetical protein [Anabaena sphaerica]MBD2292521.1 hypothetical protein [Anabaena sphaerica FACHB-251]